jgi:hypothetical protein
MSNGKVMRFILTDPDTGEVTYNEASFSEEDAQVQYRYYVDEVKLQCKQPMSYEEYKKMLLG